MVDDVVGNNLGAELEQGGVRRVDHRPHPVRVRPAEGLDPGEVLEQPAALGAVERLVDAEQVGVAMQVGDRPVERFQFLGQRPNVVAESGGGVG
jgi:hypothetical protein